MSAPGRIYSAPLLVNWSLNYSCNFSCELLLALQKAEELPRNKSWGRAGSRIKHAVRQFQRRRAPAAGICWRCRGITAFGLALSLNSNGWLLDEGAAAGLRAAGFVSVGLSLDSHRPEVHDRFRNRPGSFERVLAAAGHLVRAGVKLTISTVVCRITPGPVPLSSGTSRAARWHLTAKCSGKDGTPLRTRSRAARVARFYREALSYARNPSGGNLLRRPDLASLGARDADQHPRLDHGKARCTCANGDVTPPGSSARARGILRDDLRTTLARFTRARGGAPTRRREVHACGHVPCLGGAPPGPSPSAAISCPDPLLGEPLRVKNTPPAADDGTGTARSPAQAPPAPTPALVRLSAPRSSRPCPDVEVSQSDPGLLGNWRPLGFEESLSCSRGHTRASHEP
jgi:hypothetical protein